MLFVFVYAAVRRPVARVNASAMQLKCLMEIVVRRLVAV